MNFKRSFTLFIVSALCVFMCHSCNSCDRPVAVENITISLDMADLTIESLYVNMGGKLLYALPTPIEASMLVKNWGIPYPELLNAPANASKYLTKKKMALNLGVYITDIVCAGLYEQSQTVLQYKQPIQMLIDGLGLQSAIDQKTIQKLEENINNKVEFLQIVSDIYVSSTAFLTEDDRDFFALAMLTGGWVEGMFIATNMIDENDVSKADKMKQIITDNKLTFDLLWQALGEMDVIPEDAVFLMLDMSYIAHLFGHQTLISAPAGDPNNNIENITPKFYADVKNYIQQLRQQLVK